jgi:hypothetical protein
MIRGIKLSIIVMLMGVFLANPITVYGSAATVALSFQQRIYSITEMDSPSPYHVTLIVRTGLNTGEVWIQRADGGNDRGILVSNSDSQRVWQISHMPADHTSSIIINANHALVADENITSQLFQISHTGGNADFQTALTASNVTITPTQLITPSDTAQPEQTGVHHTITLSDHEPSAQVIIGNTTAVWHGIEIIGDERFIQRTIRAMETVEQGPCWAYEYITTSLDSVVQHSVARRAGVGGHLNVQTRIFYVYSGTYMGDVMWYASALIHEAVHARQYKEYLAAYGDRPPRRITFYSTFEEKMRIETEALEIQIRFLEEAGASKRMIDMTRSFIGTVWWR